MTLRTNIKVRQKIFRFPRMGQLTPAKKTTTVQLSIGNPFQKQSGEYIDQKILQTFLEQILETFPGKRVYFVQHLRCFEKPQHHFPSDTIDAETVYRNPYLYDSDQTWCFKKVLGKVH